jgi:hypothetical protein
LQPGWINFSVLSGPLPAAGHASVKAEYMPVLVLEISAWSGVALKSPPASRA